MITVHGKCSEFGGPNDTGMTSTEGLALYPSSARSEAPPGIFLNNGVLGHNLNPNALYCAMRWNPKTTPYSYLRKAKVAVTASNGKTIEVSPVDWGPNENTGRVIDLSPGALAALGITTDDIVTATYALPGETPTSVSTTSPVPLARPIWPLQNACISFYGNPYSEGWLHANTVEVHCPWPLKVDGTTQSSILIHKKCADSLSRVLSEIWERCGKDINKIAALKYNIFDGSYVLRAMRGSSNISMHSYAIAIDFDADENEFHGPKHIFTEDSIIVQAFEREGWTWGGRWSTGSKDWMHFQAARVNTNQIPMPPPLVIVIPSKPTPIPLPVPTSNIISDFLKSVDKALALKQGGTVMTDTALPTGLLGTITGARNVLRVLFKILHPIAQVLVKLDPRLAPFAIALPAAEQIIESVLQVDDQGNPLPGSTDAVDPAAQLAAAFSNFVRLQAPTPPPAA